MLPFLLMMMMMMMIMMSVCMCVYVCVCALARACVCTGMLTCESEDSQTAFARGAVTTSLSWTAEGAFLWEMRYKGSNSEVLWSISQF